MKTGESTHFSPPRPPTGDYSRAGIVSLSKRRCEAVLLYANSRGGDCLAPRVYCCANLKTAGNIGFARSARGMHA